MMNDTRVMSMEELQIFLNSSDSLKFNGYPRTETYAWIEKTLRQYKYLARSRVEKGLLRQYLRKVSGYSPAQVTRLIDQFHSTTHLCVRPYKRHRFPTKFTREDQLLLAEVDEAHERLSGPATQAILKREYELFAHQEFKRLSTISVSHLYRLRQSSLYRNHTLTVHKTKPATARYGERRRPDPQGQPGYLRVDTVHQGDRDGQKGVYHLNTVDAVSQWEIIGCVSLISERYLVPVVKDLLTQYPFVTHGFHSDNGSLPCLPCAILFCSVCISRGLPGEILFCLYFTGCCHTSPGYSYGAMNPTNPINSMNSMNHASLLHGGCHLYKIQW